MKKILYFLFVLFAFAPFIANGQGGCEALIKDARTLAKNLKFDEAVKKVEAAKGCASQAEIDQLYKDIFAGLKKQTRDAENAKIKVEKQEIATRAELARADSLYKELVNSQKQTSLMRDSVEESTIQNLRMQEKIALLIQLNDFEVLGDNELKNKNYAKSISYYSEIIYRLGKSETKDSSLIRKEIIVQQKLTNTSQILSAKIKFDDSMRAGDSLLNKGLYYFPSAYRAYLDAKKIDFGKDSLLSVVKNIECCLSSNLRKTKKLPNKKFIAILANSGEANAFIGNTSFSHKRIRQSLRFSKPDSSFIKDADLLRYAQKYSKSYYRRIAFYIEQEGLFGHNRSPFIKRSGYGRVNETSVYIWESLRTTFGLTFNVIPILDLGINFSKKEIPNLLSNTDVINYKLAQNDASTYDFDSRWNISPFVLISVYNSTSKNNTKRKIPIKIQGIIGFERSKYPSLQVDYETRSKNFGSLFGGYIYQINETDLGNGYFISKNFQYYSWVDSISISRITIKHNSIKNNNIYIGGRGSISPFLYIPYLEFYVGFTRKVPIDRNFRKNVRFNLSDVAYKNIQQTYKDVNIDATKTFLDENWNYDVEIKPYGRQFLYLWSINCGASYRF